MTQQNFQKALAAILTAMVALTIIGAISLLSRRADVGRAPLDVNPALIPADGEISLAGTIECLPHRDTSGPQTLECAFGLMDDNGLHYALRDSDPTYANVSGAGSGERVTAHGFFERGDDPKYASVGIITVDRITSEGGENETTSDGTISFTRPSDFGLAVTPEQILVTTYIPVCEPGFKYCLYFSGAEYEDTNFDGAGLGIRERADLTTQDMCLNTQPDGYTGLVPTTASREGYAVSTFAPLGDAGAGHYSNGEQYRVFTSGKCYQFETRVGESQFANYPAGSVREFTEADRNAMLAKLRGIVTSISLESTGGTIELP